MNVFGARETFVTVDYSTPIEPDTQAMTLFLTRVKPRPRPAIVDKRGLVTMYGRATTTTTSARVPRLSLLVALDREQQRVLTRMRRKYFVAVAFVFAIGMIAGAFAMNPALRVAARALLHRWW